MRRIVIKQQTFIVRRPLDRTRYTVVVLTTVMYKYPLKYKLNKAFYHYYSETQRISRYNEIDIDWWAGLINTFKSKVPVKPESNESCNFRSSSEGF
jgi:hypothetical protein